MSGDRRLHRLLLRAYPPGWRRRYGAELLALLAERRSGWRDVPDLLRGAFDAWLSGRVAARQPALPGPLLATVPARSVAAVSLPVSSRAHGIVATAPSPGEMSRRAFMRRLLGAGVTLLTLEFATGTINFLWPQIRQGLGAKFRVGTVKDVLAVDARFANGWPYAYNPARAFLVNVPAAKELALGQDVSITELAAPTCWRCGASARTWAAWCRRPAIRSPGTSAAAIAARTTSWARRCMRVRPSVAWTASR
jgi:hypothetical protein